MSSSFHGSSAVSPSRDNNEDPETYGLNGVNLDREWTLDFHGTVYIINVSANNSSLLVDIEDADSTDRWSFEFSSQYVEDMTLKAGSYKKFEIFVRMLSSALSKASDSVFVDILTFSDLEILKARKRASSPSKSTANASTSSNQKSHLKRYLILTYAGEFDKVHYPLPLSFEDEASTDALKRTISRLRSRLQQLPERETNIEKERLSKVMSQLRQENTELKHKIRQIERRNESLLPQGGTTNVNELLIANARLQRQITELKKQLTSSSNDYERLRIQSAKEISKWRLLASQSQFSPQTNNLSDSKDQTIKVLKHRIAEIEKTLILERKNRLYPNNSLRSFSAPKIRNDTISPSNRSSRLPSYLKSTAASSSRLERPRSLSPLVNNYDRLDHTTLPHSYRKGREFRYESPTLSSRPPSGSTYRQKVPVPARRNSESGYSSANSQSSRGSDRSNGSRRSNKDDVKVIRKKSSPSSQSVTHQRQDLSLLSRNGTRFPLSGSRSTSSEPQETPSQPSKSTLSSNNNTSYDIHRGSIDENINTISNRLSMDNSSINSFDSLEKSNQTKENTSKAEEGDIGEIDKRIKALQNFLDKARSGLSSSVKN